MKKLLVILLVLGLAAPAMAQTNFQFYGSLRTHVGYYDVSEEYVGGPAYDGTIGADSVNHYVQEWGTSDGGTVLTMSGQSRLGVRGFASDKLMGVVEFGLTETTRTGKSQSPYTRLAFGQWNFGAGTLIFGKHYTPGTFLGYSNMIGDLGDQGDANMLVGGLAYIGRHPQIRLSIAGFEIAAIERNTAAPGLYSNPYAANTVPNALWNQEQDWTLPRFEAAYVFRTPMVAIRPVVGYQTYKVVARDGATQTEVDERIDSYMAGLGVSLTLGPAYVKMTGSYLQNAGNYGQSNLMLVSAFNLPTSIGGAGSSILNAQLDSNGDVEDSKLMQGTFVAGFNVSPTLFIEAGFGIANAKIDVDGEEAKQTGMLFYLQSPITLAKGFTLIPEVGHMDRGDLKVSGPGFSEKIDAGKMTYFVANLRIDF